MIPGIPLAAGDVRDLVVYELGRLARFDDPRTLWIAVAIILAATVLYVVALYRRERAQLSLLLAWLLPGLRLLALVGTLLFFLSPVKRVDHRRVTDSRVLLLVDTSQSMSVEDETLLKGGKVSRSEAIVHALTRSSLVEDLRRQHDVALAVFDQQLDRIWRWQRSRTADSHEEEERKTADAHSWIEKLQPVGGATRIGDALEGVLLGEGGGPLAGVILFSDGGSNSGVQPLTVAEIAGKRKIPLHTVGVGSTSSRRNLRIQELSAPARVYPDDKTLVRALVQADGFAGRSVNVELRASESSTGRGGSVIMGEQELSFDSDKQVFPLQFEIEPAEIGELNLELKICAPSDDQVEADNIREVEIEVVEAQSRVMLLASGAARDYRFLRNQLHRDRYATVDVLLQSAQPGISQDADKILDAFPSTKEDLYPYDCIVAFDPDWAQLDAQQVELLESWVAEEAGGMIVIAGPIHTASWVQSPEHSTLRALYPVEFQKRLTLLDDGLYGSKTPWPIDFSRDGEECNYLWLAGTSGASRALWSEFAGVFGCYAVKGPKPGAHVLGRYSDPEAGISAERPVYLAEHFYGSGRVFYMGSGEVWRLRMLDVGYFEMLYTSLIRHVSQGRILRGSSQGRLLVQRDRYSVGDEVDVRAQLMTASREPVIAPQVIAHVMGPQGTSQSVPLRADEDRPGNFLGQFTTKREGSYRIELPVPNSLEDPLAKRIQVVVPDLEFDETRRDEMLLAAIASRSGGSYYANLKAIVQGNSELPPAGQLIPSRTELETVKGTPDKTFTLWLNRLLLGVICGALCLEWFLRRLVRLA
ncbi:MAG: VWA domain-containing protein [Pirellulales bacterium]|nr:VWA domain-containing protein [Pirellulales bacterium]